MDGMTKQHESVTVILREAAAGNPSASERLMPLVYDQLRAAARKCMAKERPEHTLSATALVHDAYLKLIGSEGIDWSGRAHFYSACAEAMQRILIDYARARGALKRGGGNERIAIDLDGLTGGRGPQGEPELDIVALCGAVDRLHASDERMAQVVRFKFFAGLEISEIALTLGVSERTVKQDWAFARAWLQRELRGKGEPGHG